MTFPKQLRSGVMPKRSCAPPLARRNPVITSSKMQQRAVGLGDLAEEFQIARLRQIQAGVARHRLHDDARNLAWVRREGRLHGLRVVIRQDDRVLRESRRHAGAVGVAERQRAGAGLDQQRIGVAVIAAVELDDLVALA